jgi:hypothetical protein
VIKIILLSKREDAEIKRDGGGREKIEKEERSVNSIIQTSSKHDNVMTSDRH